MMWAALDLEMNQPSGSIIQIGIIDFDPTKYYLNIVTQMDLVVNSGEVLNPEIVKLTGITQAKHDQGRPIAEALVHVWRLLAKRRVCVTWGRDLDMLKDVSAKVGVAIPRVRGIDLKQTTELLRCALPASQRKGGLAQTMDEFGRPYEGRQHDAVHDAENTARLACAIVHDRMRYLAIEPVMKDRFWRAR